MKIKILDGMNREFQMRKEKLKMGYYTRYDMSVYEGDYNSYDIVKFMAEKNKECDAYYAFEYDLKNTLDDINDQSGAVYALSLEGDDECKWYEHEKEMRDLSKVFPDVVFKLHGEGEENGDIWDKYFMNGKMQYCPAQISLPPFDKTKLV